MDLRDIFNYEWLDDIAADVSTECHRLQAERVVISSKLVFLRLSTCSAAWLDELCGCWVELPKGMSDFMKRDGVEIHLIYDNGVFGYSLMDRDTLLRYLREEAV